MFRVDKTLFWGQIRPAMKTAVRIASIEIENLKNVHKGSIVMPRGMAGFNPDEGELLGIYGQNGTGKTAVVNAIGLIYNLINGYPLEDEVPSLMTYGRNTSTLTVVFKVEGEQSYDVQYSITLARDADTFHIRREALTLRVNKSNARTSTIAEFNEESMPVTEDVFPNATLLKIQGLSSRQDILVNKVLAYQSKRSYIFNERMFGLLLNLGEDQAVVLQAVRNFAEKQLFIFSHWNTGLVNLNTQPIHIAHCGESGTDIGTCFISLNAPAAFPIGQFACFKETLKQINQVLCTLIPGLTLSVKELGTELQTADKEVMRFELLSSRDGMQIPLKQESDGIKKIVAMLLHWITASNTPGSCLVVDELDASIFEYLLGELLSIWKEHAQGQLIFTAHNLHPLEVLDKRSVVFTTTNPEERFIRLKNIKTCNNLRDVYLRSIFVGGQEYELYDETSKTDIARAIRMCTSNC